jgi:hypothetical protein
MKLCVRTAAVVAIVMVFGLGQALSAQTLPLDVLATRSADGPIARATALELAKLEHAAPAADFNRDDRAIGLTKREARPADATAAVRQSKRGVIGAVIGAAAGAVLGVGLAIGYATRDCGGSCSDERAMIGVSLIGIPVAAGVAGYYIAK